MQLIGEVFFVWFFFGLSVETGLRTVEITRVSTLLLLLNTK